MSERLPSVPKLQFPIICHYRIIAVNRNEISVDIESVLKKFEVKTKLQDGNKSNKSNYLSFGVDINVKSKEEMCKVNSDLLNVEGVKMVL
ncbi:MAG: hypothetical protein A2Y03_09940 [Omnitrophica WOR_2 bacterium GWF2_38_59]|nr:MAG: hypothetical protein A2Y03_09940 [Omnitrophica WOR_2 bacterium GWF2_38_59]OGX50841.1 MAG: hypothetical protein A2243_06045 [Omnitrophica WOR_2 bacterium RIFOXYA2_FULL_38_17]OGX53389.1 MAG: hypothetical protein A2267_01685 [Omnitrophica WOR_2 bacterium RIFOXYA12_FULL_38_10]OGX57178.1 MAG: hypothetical protein A2447_09710 [Omnitrophica WOR_2 bacterium RIFOXYC2_FULL_38_12]OGX59081.1 MAG: hypothetical protein A2306_03515 [Omnitrophica WOR_2 bacterium RIFOXYB2_FULL_38_16]HBG60518.1 hypothet